jgi:hypothetical protein
MSEPLQETSNLGDSSGPEPLYSMYLRAARKEDEEMVEGWQQDAKAIIIFVSACVGIHASSSHIN